MKRRDFVQSAALASSALVTSSALASVTTKPKSQIGLILYTLRDHLKTKDDIKRTLARVREIGYTNVELASVGAMSHAELAKVLEENELSAVSAHASWGQMKDDPKGAAESYAEVGCSHLITSSIPGEYRSGEGYREFAKVASEVAANLGEYGVTWGYHNHSFEFEHYDGMSGQEIMLQYSVPMFFQFEIDTYWIQHGGGDPAAWIEKCEGRVPTVHMKDMIKMDGNQAFAEVGVGNLNWPAIINACNAAGAKYLIVEQDVCYRDPFESITLSYNNMRSWGLV